MLGSIDSKWMTPHGDDDCWQQWPSFFSSLLAASWTTHFHSFTLLQHIETKNVLRCRSNIALLRFLFRRRRPFSSEFFFSPFPHGHVGNCWFPATKERCFWSLLSLECFPTNGSLRFPVEHVAQAREGAKMAFQQDALLVPRWTGGSRATHVVCFSNTIFLTLYVFTLSLSLCL